MSENLRNSLLNSIYKNEFKVKIISDDCNKEKEIIQDYYFNKKFPLVNYEFVKTKNNL